MLFPRSLHNRESCFNEVYFLTWDGSLEEEETGVISGFELLMLPHLYLMHLSWTKELPESEHSEHSSYR